MWGQPGAPVAEGRKRKLHQPAREVGLPHTAWRAPVRGVRLQTAWGHADSSRCPPWPRLRCLQALVPGCSAQAVAVWGAAEPLSAETHGQAVPRVRVLFPPPAGAVVLVMAPVAHGGPHASATHRAVAASLGVAVGAFHGQLHATVLLMIQVRAGQ